MTEHSITQNTVIDNNILLYKEDKYTDFKNYYCTIREEIVRKIISIGGNTELFDRWFETNSMKDKCLLMIENMPHLKPPKGLPVIQEEFTNIFIINVNKLLSIDEKCFEKYNLKDRETKAHFFVHKLLYDKMIKDGYTPLQ
jgi:hypothetical protein